MLLDTGADINVIRSEALSPTAKVKERRKINITGVGPGQITTLGTTRITVLGQRLVFHVLPQESSFSEDGLLGNTFFIEQKARVLYDLKVMEIHGKRVPFEYSGQESTRLSPIPLDDDYSSQSSSESDSSSESSDEDEEFTPKPCHRVFRIKKTRGVPSRIKYSLPPRMKVPIEIPVTDNSPEGEAFLPLIKSPPGVFIGNAAVEHRNGTCFVFAINTSEDEVKIDIPAQELQRFDFEDSDDFFESEPEGSPPGNLEERISRILLSLKRPHHDPAALAQIERVVRKFPFLFMMPGDPPPKTSYVEHQIPTTDNIPIYTKQYRYSPALQKEVKEQMEDLLKKGVIRNNFV